MSNVLNKEDHNDESCIMKGTTWAIIQPITTEHIIMVVYEPRDIYLSSKLEWWWLLASTRERDQHNTFHSLTIIRKHLYMFKHHIESYGSLFPCLSRFIFRTNNLHLTSPNIYPSIHILVSCVSLLKCVHVIACYMNYLFSQILPL